MECKQRETSCKRERDSLFFSFQLPFFNFPFSTSLLVKFRQKKKKTSSPNFWALMASPSLRLPKKNPQRLIQSDLIYLLCVCVCDPSHYKYLAPPPTFARKVFFEMDGQIYIYGPEGEMKKGGFPPPNWTRSNRIEMDGWMNEIANLGWMMGKGFGTIFDSEKIPWIKWCEDNVSLCMCGRERERVLFIAGQARLYCRII